MSQEDLYYVVAFYIFTPIEDPHAEVAKHVDFFKERDIRSRIYISHHGINGQMSGLKSHAIEYMEWMKEDERFQWIDFKIHTHGEQVFPRATVKYREQLVALDHQADPKEAGERVSPAEWRKMLEEKGEDVLLLDVRNDYEWKIGHFEGSVKPPLDMFREFPNYAKELKKEYDPKRTKVMMCCTGGIRCELYSALMKKEGFERVYQLDGGIIKYGLQEGEHLWKGKLFVFDDRMAVPISKENEAEVIGRCHFCEVPVDTYYNCANMDCNEMFLSCSSCAEARRGCCSATCEAAPRIRPHETMQNGRPRPFRRKHLCESAAPQ